MPLVYFICGDKARRAPARLASLRFGELRRKRQPVLTWLGAVAFGPVFALMNGDDVLSSVVPDTIIGPFFVGVPILMLGFLLALIWATLLRMLSR